MNTRLILSTKIVSFRRADTNGNGRIDEHELSGLVAIMIDGEDFSVLTRDYIDGLKGVTASYLKSKRDTPDHVSTLPLHQSIQLLFTCRLVYFVFLFVCCCWCFFVFCFVPQ
jgi:hypothetical protein